MQNYIDRHATGVDNISHVSHSQTCPCGFMMQPSITFVSATEYGIYQDVGPLCS